MKLWLLNKNEEIEKVLKTTYAKHTIELNGANFINFECQDRVEKMDRVIYKDHLNKYHEFIVQEVVEDNEITSVYAENSAYELRGDFIENKRPNATAFIHLTTLLEKTRWEVGIVEGSTEKFVSYYRQDVLKSINDLVVAFGMYRDFEVVITNNKITKRKINLRQQAGKDNGKRFVYGKDLKGITRTILMDDIVTALYGFGKGEEIGEGYGRRISFADLDKPDSPVGQMYIEDNDAKAIWGRNSNNGKKHIFRSIEFDEIEDVEELYIATKAELQKLKEPRVNYSASVELLKEGFENVDVGDTVAIIDKDFRGMEIRLKGVVFKVVRDLFNREKSEVELGNYIDDITDVNNNLKKYVNEFRNKSGIWDKANAFDANGRLEASYINDIVGAWNDQLNGAGGFVYAEPGQGIITYDRAIDDDPTMAIQITGAGWRIANSKLPNGEWDWRTLGTGDGIYGDEIIANSITTNQLSSDVGTILDITSNTAINQLVTQIDEQGNLLQDEISAQSQLTKDEFQLIFTRIANEQDLTNDEIETLKSYFRVNENGVIIGKSGSTIEFFAENNRVGFRENGQDIAYWEEGTMHVDNLIAIMTIIIGYHHISKYDSPVIGDSTIIQITDRGGA